MDKFFNFLIYKTYLFAQNIKKCKAENSMISTKNKKYIKTKKNMKKYT